MSDPSATFYPKDYATIIALLLGPVISVAVTLWYQKRSERRAEKRKLFITLMANRKANPPSADWAGALNLIDVVFTNSPKIVSHGHTLYQVMQTKPWNYINYNHAYLDLLSAIANDLGYHKLTQTDIDKFYSPEAHGQLQARQDELQQEFLRVLRASQNFGSQRAPDAK
jgi:hypothetical protein